MWIQKAKGTPIAVAAERLKLSIRKGRSLSPCPACGEQNRGSGDKRGPVGVNTSDTAWRCHVCGKRGDVVDLVSYAISGGKLRDINKDKQRKVYAWFEGTGFSEKYKDFKPKITKPKRPEVSEVASLWRAAKPLNQMNGRHGARIPERKKVRHRPTGSDRHRESIANPQPIPVACLVAIHMVSSLASCYSSIRDNRKGCKPTRKSRGPKQVKPEE